MSKRTTLAALGAAALLGASIVPAAAQGGPYVRLGIGYDWSGAATFNDIDCAADGNYFGCGPGNDGLQRAARGSFGSSTSFEIGIGTYAAPAIRLEAVLGYRPGFEFTGQANFDRYDPPQPVTGAASQAGIMGFVYADLGTLAGYTGPVQPYVGFGVGVSRNVVGDMLYEFPTAQFQPRYSLMPGGVNYDMSVAVAAGIAYRASDRLTVDLGWRWTRYGVVMTDDTELFIQYQSSNNTVPINHTWAVLKSNSVLLSLRWAL